MGHVGAGGNFGGGHTANLIATPAGDSQLGEVLAKGGQGGGGSDINKPGGSGGSGGGGGHDRINVARSKGTAGQGHGGGITNLPAYGAGGGGGGAGEAGADAPQKHYGGKGGDGISSDITGATKFYEGGGGGGINDNSGQPLTRRGGLGGKGGGGRGSDFGSKALGSDGSQWEFTGADQMERLTPAEVEEARTRSRSTQAWAVLVLSSRATRAAFLYWLVGKCHRSQATKYAPLRVQEKMRWPSAMWWWLRRWRWRRRHQRFQDYAKRTEWGVVVGDGGRSGQGGATGAQDMAKSKLATKGGDSKLGSLVAIGGGHGADKRRVPGDGGSGGGISFDRNDVEPGRSTPGRGFPGGHTFRDGYGSGGGGGGAGGRGETTLQLHLGGKGGDGVSSEITGTLKWYGGGGGGGVNDNGKAAVENGGGGGGKGGGGKGSDWGSTTDSNPDKFTGTDGEENTGGGGGGTDPECRVAGKGGSGIVVVRYKSMTSPCLLAAP